MAGAAAIGTVNDLDIEIGQMYAAIRLTYGRVVPLFLSGIDTG